MVWAAGRVAASGAALGLLGQLLFVGVAPGINLIIAVAAVLAAAWRLRPRGLPLRVTDALLPTATLLYAGFVALRDDPTLVALDIIAVLVLTAASLAAIGGAAVVTRPLLAVGDIAARLAVWTGVGAAWVLLDAGPAAPSLDRFRRRIGGAGPVLRGLAIALPLALVFIGLFAAADAVFAELVNNLFDWDLDLADVPGRVVVAAVIGWLAAGALAFVATPGEERIGPAPRLRWLGTTEALTILIVIDLTFAAFVALQLAYLFGGLDTLQATGMTYSEYARRGFFELIAVAVLAGGLLLALETFVKARPREYVGAAIALAGLTSVVLASATLRMRLYQEAYGWTELRFYALAVIGWLAIGVVLAAMALATNRSRWLPHALAVAGLAVGIAVNVIGPVRFVADQNVARLANPALVPAFGSTGLDTIYAADLGDDAVPALVRALPYLPRDERHYLRDVLSGRLVGLRVRDDLNAWQAWNLSRATARAALDRALGGLEP